MFESLAIIEAKGNPRPIGAGFRRGLAGKLYRMA